MWQRNIQECSNFKGKGAWRKAGWKVHSPNVGQTDFVPIQGTEIKRSHLSFTVLNVSRSVVSNSLWPHGLYLTRLLCPWDYPSKNTGVGCHSFLQGIFPTQGSNSGLLHCRQILYHLSHQGSSCVFILLDKMRHTNIFFKVYLSKTQFKLGRVKPEVVGRAPLIEAGGKTFLGKRQKQSKEIIWLAAASVGVFFEKVKLAVCDWLSLGFSFLTFRHFRHRLWFAKVGFL